MEKEVQADKRPVAPSRSINWTNPEEEGMNPLLVIYA